MRVALECDERVGVPGDSLDELDVGTRRDEARDAGVPEIVEAVALALEPGEPEGRIPDALPEVRRLSGVPRIDAKTSSSGA